MNLSEMIATGYSLYSTSLTYQIYKKEESYRVYNRDTDVSELYTQDLEKLNIFVRIRENQYLVSQLIATHGLIA